MPFGVVNGHGLWCSGLAGLLYEIRAYRWANISGNGREQPRTDRACDLGMYRLDYELVTIGCADSWMCALVSKGDDRISVRRGASDQLLLSQTLTAGARADTYELIQQTKKYGGIVRGERVRWRDERGCPRRGLRVRVSRTRNDFAGHRSEGVRDGHMQREGGARDRRARWVQRSCPNCRRGVCGVDAADGGGVVIT